jgi:hypothetical protein
MPADNAGTACAQTCVSRGETTVVPSGEFCLGERSPALPAELVWVRPPPGTALLAYRSAADRATYFVQTVSFFPPTFSSLQVGMTGWPMTTIWPEAESHRAAPLTVRTSPSQ